MNRRTFLESCSAALSCLPFVGGVFAAKATGPVIQTTTGLIEDLLEGKDIPDVLYAIRDVGDHAEVAIREGDFWFEATVKMDISDKSVTLPIPQKQRGHIRVGRTNEGYELTVDPYIGPMLDAEPLEVDWFDFAKKHNT